MAQKGTNKQEAIKKMGKKMHIDLEAHEAENNKYAEDEFEDETTPDSYAINMKKREVK